MGKAGGICLDVSQTVKPARNLESNSNMILGLDASIAKKKKKSWLKSVVLKLCHAAESPGRLVKKLVV